MIFPSYLLVNFALVMILKFYKDNFMIYDSTIVIELYVQ